MLLRASLKIAAKNQQYTICLRSRRENLFCESYIRGSLLINYSIFGTSSWTLYFPNWLWLNVLCLCFTDLASHLIARQSCVYVDSADSGRGGSTTPVFPVCWLSDFSAITGLGCQALMRWRYFPLGTCVVSVWYNEHYYLCLWFLLPLGCRQLTTFNLKPLSSLVLWTPVFHRYLG